MKENYIKTPYIFNTSIFIDPVCYTIGGSFSENEVWGKELIEETFEILKTIDSPFFIDIGANLGAFTLLALFKSDLKVLAFEPFNKVADILEELIEFNKLKDSVEIQRTALSNYIGEAKLKCCYNHSGMSTLGPSFNLLPYIEEEVQVTTLDEFCKTSSITKIDFIKIDIEGSELFMLEGAKHTIKKFRPVILIETARKRTDYFNYIPDKIIECLKSFGYNKFETRKTDTLAQIE